MVEQASLLPVDAEEAPALRHSTGIVPMQEIRRLVREKVLCAAPEPIGDDQIQPASVDLRLGAKAYRVRASFLPNPGARVSDTIRALSKHAEVDLTHGAVLEKGCVYIVPLLESVRFTKRMFGFANPRSSTGRLDIFTRLITDHASVFDQVPEGYGGPLYAEVSPRTFSVVARKGSRLLQLRVRLGSPHASDTGIRRLHEEIPLVHTGGTDAVEKMRISGGLAVTVDLKGDPASRLIGYKAKPHADLIDVDKVGAYDPLDYWDPIEANRDGTLILDPGAFYVLVSKEAVTIPPDHAAEMIPFNPLQGAFRVHYAGFFDPGFGHGHTGHGARAVLEVRSYEVPFVLEHGQIVARLVYERLRQEPDRLYGRDIGSSYQQQGLALSRHFRRE